MKETLFEAETSHAPHDLIEMASLAPIFGAARRAHDGIEPALRQNGQCIHHHLMVLVRVKLIWQIEISFGQLVLRHYLDRICGQELRRWLGCETNDAGLALRSGIECPEVAMRAFAAQHDGPPGCDLHSETGFATPPRCRRKQLGQPSMLKIGKPGHCGIRQTPAEETGGFEDDIDTLRPEFCRRLAVQAQRQRGSQTGSTLERRRSHHLHSRYSRKRRKIGIVVTCPGEQDGSKLALAELAQRRKKIALIVVATGPKPARNMRKREARRRSQVHRL